MVVAIPSILSARETSTVVSFSGPIGGTRYVRIDCRSGERVYLFFDQDAGVIAPGAVLVMRPDRGVDRYAASTSQARSMHAAARARIEKALRLA